MARVLICSYNQSIIDKCSKALANDHEIESAEEFNLNSNAEIIILDADLVDNNSEILNSIKKHSCDILLIGAEWPEDEQIKAMLHLASGYFEQSKSDELLRKAVNSILEGEIWINRHLIPKVIHSFAGIKPPPDDCPPSSAATEMLKTLSSREMDVAKLVSQGENNKQIASTLFISERTVKAHLTSIFRKLNVTDRLHLAVLLKENS